MTADAAPKPARVTRHPVFLKHHHAPAVVAGDVRDSAPVHERVTRC